MILTEYSQREVRQCLTAPRRDFTVIQVALPFPRVQRQFCHHSPFPRPASFLRIPVPFLEAFLTVLASFSQKEENPSGVKITPERLKLKKYATPTITLALVNVL